MSRIVLALHLIGLFAFGLISRTVAAQGWDGRWTGEWAGRPTEIKVSGNTLQCTVGGVIWICHSPEFSRDTLSFMVGREKENSWAATFRRTGVNTAIATRNPSSGGVTFTRSALQGQSGWDGTWKGYIEHTKAPFEIVVSGNQPMAYIFGGARISNRIVSSSSSTKALSMEVADGQGRLAKVNLYREGRHTALYEFKTDKGGVRTTGTAFRQ
jgi:hypothetical protein